MLIPNGSYPAIVGGSVAEFFITIHGERVKRVAVQVKFPVGVRGIGIHDTVTINGDKITSTVLGNDGVIIK